MSTTQLTIRNIPEPVNRYLRKRAQISGKSLNQVIIDELCESSGVVYGSVEGPFDWFFGSGMDDETLKALAEDEREQKALAAKEL
jgi:hypothetical protein